MAAYESTLSDVTGYLVQAELVSPGAPAETAAIALAESLHAELLLMDERAGSPIAPQRGLTVTGTLGVLNLTAKRGLTDFSEAIRSLSATNFRLPGQVVRTHPAKHAGNKKA